MVVPSCELGGGQGGGCQWWRLSVVDTAGDCQFWWLMVMVSGGLCRRIFVLWAVGHVNDLWGSLGVVSSCGD